MLGTAIVEILSRHDARCMVLMWDEDGDGSRDGMLMLGVESSWEMRCNGWALV